MEEPARVIERSGLDLCVGRRVLLSANWVYDHKPGDESTYIDMAPGAGRQYSYHARSGIARIRGHGPTRAPPSYPDYRQLIQDPAEIARDLWRSSTDVWLVQDLGLTGYITFEDGRYRADLVPIFQKLADGQFERQKLPVSALKKRLPGVKEPVFLVYAPNFRESLLVIRLDGRTIVVPSIGARRGRQFRLPYYRDFGAIINREIGVCIPDIVNHVRKAARRLDEAGSTQDVLQMGKAHKDARQSIAALLD